jgi:hypothetical protein
MIYDLMKRPKVIWIVALWNIICVISTVLFLVFGYFLFENELNFTLAELLIDAWLELLIGIILIAASALVLFDRFQSPFLMMIIAITFYSINIYSAITFGMALQDGSTSIYILRATVRNLIYIGLNFWTMYGPGPQAYFKAVDKYFRS